MHKPSASSAHTYRLRIVKEQNCELRTCQRTFRKSLVAGIGFEPMTFGL